MSNITHLSPDEKKKLEGYINEISNSMTRMDAERDLIKDIIDKANDEFTIDKKIIRKLARIYHKQSLIEEQTEAEAVFDVYENLFG